MQNYNSQYTDGRVAVVAREDKSMLINEMTARFRTTQTTLDMHSDEIAGEYAGRVRVNIFQLGRTAYGGDCDAGRVLPTRKIEGYHIVNDYVTVNTTLVKEIM